MLKTKVLAFTLLECLTALLVLSGSLLVYEGLTKVIVQENRYQQQMVDKEWLVFAEQLRLEWSSVDLLRVEGNKIIVDKEGQRLAFGKSRADDFRKTNENGRGYQPMLYRVASAIVKQSGQAIRIDFTFTTGEERSFVYVFE